MKFSLCLLATLFVSNNTFALVDYTETSPIARPAKKAAARPVIQRAAPRKAVRSNSGSRFLDFDLGYRQVNVGQSNLDGKVSFLEFKGHIQTKYNLFLDFSYWGASGDSIGLSSQTGYQKGNPQVVLGFNWLRFGKAEEMSTVDLYVGGKFSGKSDFSTTRTDKIAGIETSKRFYDFALALAYEYTITGAPADDELSIGNMQNLKASLGWVVSPDIQFVVEANNYTINDDKDGNQPLKLEEKVSFASISPMVNLGISPSISMKMGATFRTKKAKQAEKLILAKLWDLPGAYGNSLFVALNFSI